MRTSLRSLASLSLSLYFAGSSLAELECPETPALSCPSSTELETPASDSCCSLAQSGALFQYTQGWSTETNRWTLNDFAVLSCDSKTPLRFCDTERSHSTEALVQHMKDYKGGFTDEWNRLGVIIETMGWPGQEIGLGLVQIWTQMWSEHATCISTLAPNCTGSEGASIADFIASIPKTHEQLNTTAFLTAASIIPSDDPAQTYTRAAILDAVQDGSNVHAELVCSMGKLQQVVYTYAVEGKYQDAKLRRPESVSPLKKQACPEQGIIYNAPVIPPYTDEEVEEAVRSLMPDESGQPAAGEFRKKKVDEPESPAEETGHVKDEL